MVDFQSRDTRRGPDDEDDAGDEPTDTEETEEAADGSDGDEATDEAESATADTDATESTESARGAPTSADPLEGEPTGDEPVADVSDQDAEDHHGDHHHGHEVGPLGVAVVTVTSTRTHEDDPSGDAIESLTAAADHDVVTRDVVGDDLDGVQRAVLALTGRDDVDAVVTTGGTGVTPDDVTVEAIEPLFDKHLPGFGELFRILSYEEVGTRALASRATAGISEGVPVFCLPGSEAAVRLAMDELVLEEVEHLVGLATRE